MSPMAVFAAYFLLWWLVFFAVLPFGVRSQSEAGDVTLGTDHGAPHAPMLLRKVIATSLIAAFLCAGLYVAVAFYGLDLEDLIVWAGRRHTKKEQGGALLDRSRMFLGIGTEGYRSRSLVPPRTWTAGAVQR